MTKEEAKAYAQKLLKESGVSDEEITQHLKLFDNDKFAQGFIARPDVDRALSAEKETYRKLQEDNKYLMEDWFPKAKETEQSARAVVSQYNRYKQLYGDIDPENTDDAKKGAKVMGITKDEVRELLKNELDSTLSSRDRATLDLMEIREDYIDRFKKRMPVKEFEKHVEALQKSGEYEGLRSAYKEWIAPDLDRANDASLNDRIKKEREEAVRDFASRNRIPTDSKPKESHLLFDNERLRAEKDKANGGDKSGRDAFLEVLSDPEPDTVKQRYPV